jgi:uncharacterized membrane protein
MHRMQKQETGEKARTAIAAVLRYGSLLSALVMAAGVGLVLLRGGVTTLSSKSSAGALLGQVLMLDPMGITELGILLLLLTPVFRVVIAVIGFAAERDSKYVLVSLGVLTVMLSSIVYALR